MVLKRFIVENKILLIAIGLSLAWHIVCISCTSVIIAPPTARQAQFPRVSFFGPIFQTSTIELRPSSPRQLSRPEERISYELRRDAYALTRNQDRSNIPSVPGADIPPAARAAISFHIKEIFGQKKLTPDNTVEAY